MSTIEDRVREACHLVEEIELSAGGLTRGVIIREEFDCHDGCAFGKDTCRPGSGGYHGCGARRILFFVRIDGQGGVGFELYAPIYLPETQARMQRRWPWEPMGSLDIHLAKPPVNAEWMCRVESQCTVAGSEDGCWCDGTSLQAEAGTEVFLNGGVEGVWSWLAEGWLPEILERVGAKS